MIGTREVVGEDDALEGKGLWREISLVRLHVGKRHRKVDEVVALGPLDGWLLTAPRKEKKWY